MGTYPAGVQGKSVFAAAIVPLTGPYAAMGHDERLGFEFAMDHLNNGSEVTQAVPSLRKGGGVLGKNSNSASPTAKPTPTPRFRPPRDSSTTTRRSFSPAPSAVRSPSHSKRWGSARK